jgi:V8-like Glu-specific endopeptidase
MAPPGHRPIRNFAPGGAEVALPPEPPILRRRVVREVGPPLVPGYVSPGELRRLRRAGGETSDLEAFAGQDTNRFVRDAAEGSFGATSLLEVVIGVDDRVPVSADLLGTDPWRQIAALRITGSTGTPYVGTAWFIGRSVLATAGHCVFLRDDGGWPTSIEVIPGLSGEDAPHGRATATRFACPDGWRDSGSRDFDYGSIFLDGSDLGSRLGAFAVEAEGDVELEGALGRISGYPADLEAATRQYYHERPLVSVTPTRLNYDIDTFGGQSGSPIWRQVDGRGAVAVGIHTTGTATGNSGTRITQAVLDNLTAWSNET